MLPGPAALNLKKGHPMFKYRGAMLHMAFLSALLAARVGLAYPGTGYKPDYGNDASAGDGLARATGKLALDCGGGVTLELVRIPAGTFIMGSPSYESMRGNDEIQHAVTISRPFYMGIYEVTQAQWQAVMGNNPGFFRGGDHPVEQVSWDDALEFCRKLSAQTGRKVRLPTEAEWEYACRAGTTTAFNTGGTISAEQANYDGDYTYGGGRKGVYRKKTTPVGIFPANAWGLYDMHGNVWEWCSDWYGKYDRTAPEDPQGISSETYRVIRGGSWHNNPGYFRSAFRYRSDPGNRSYDLGFRVALD
jgi:formylglycine-generating enzyme required for sulfatase activity